MRVHVGSLYSLARVASLALIPLLAWTDPVAAQGQPTGFELALHGSPQVLRDRTAHFRGIAYQVRGLAELKPLARARVRARYHTDVAGTGAWVTIEADRSGFFQIAVPMPARPAGTSRLQVGVGDGRTERRFEFPLSFSDPFVLDHVTDRQLYEPGETIHAWARLRDRRSRKPLAGVTTHMTLMGTDALERVVSTAASGVATTSVKIPKEAQEGDYQLITRIGARTFRHGFRIGTRTYERLFATVSLSPGTAKPHQPVTVTVKVTTASGALVRNAAVTATLDKTSTSGTTDKNGLAALAMQAPAYMTHATGAVSVNVKVSHPAHGSALARGVLRLAVPLILKVEAVPANAGLVPDLDGTLYVRLSEGSGKPPAVGTPVTVRGAAIRNGVQRGTSDVHGIITIPTRLPRGAAIDTYDEAATSVLVHVEGKAPRTAAIAVPVARDTEIVPTVSAPVAAPGDTITISLARRTSARKLPAVVDVLAGDQLLETRLLKPGQNRVAVTAPRDRLGVIQVRARPLRQRGVVEGVGGTDAFLVRPPKPSFPTLRADKQVYRVKDQARLTLRTNPDAPKSWAAVLVRDLAAHAGERPFSYTFLAGAFDRAILDPDSKAADTLLRTALAEYTYREEAPKEAPPLLDDLGEPAGREYYDIHKSSERNVMRDPYPMADELSRRGIGEVMKQVEQMLATALDEGRLNDVSTVRAGRKRGFKAGLLREIDDAPHTLGDGRLTIAMLTAADPSFTYNNIGARIARKRLVKLLVALAYYLDPGDEATPQQRTAAREPSNRWLPRMVERGLISAEALLDPWGGSFALRKTQKPRLAIAVEAANFELVSPGPDGKLGTRDDIGDPFARAVPAGTPYAVASGEDQLMAALARLSPGEEVLRRLLEAYQRVTAEVAEEEQGDAVNASVSGGFGMSGVGAGGGGSGSGYGIGSGRGGMRGRGSGAPGVRVGSASAGRSGISGFAHVLRERFPPTLYFAPALTIDRSGKTDIPLALSEAVTTYLVEVVVWSAEGWTWSAQTRIRVDRETVVDAPVPRYATVGDKLLLPVRIGNRRNAAQVLTVAVFAPDNPDQPLAERTGVRVPAKDAIEVPITLPLPHTIDGHVTVGIRSSTGRALDAVRRPISVFRPTRRVRRKADMLTGGADSLRLNVPRQATPRKGAQVMVRVGADIFPNPKSGILSDWAQAWQDTREPVTEATMNALRNSSRLRIATAVGAAWSADEVDDYYVERALRRLTQLIDRVDRGSKRENGSRSDRNAGVSAKAKILLNLAPTALAINARPDLKKDLVAILRSLRQDVHADAAQVSDRPQTWAVAAAALAVTNPPKGKLKRVRELVRRVRRQQLSVGDYTWVADKQDTYGTSALLALAELQLGERKRALALLRTLGRLTVEGQIRKDPTRGLVRAVAVRASRGTPGKSLKIRIDSEVRDLELRGGLARISAPVLSRPGQHTIRVDRGGKGGLALYYLEAVTEYGLPWDLVPDRPGSLEVAIEGETGARDQRAKLEIIVRNRSPRSIAKPILELNLPAGAELDEDGRQSMRRRAGTYPEATRGTLRLPLAGLPPGGTRRIPLPLRWSVGGALQGLGVAVYPADRPDDLTVLAPRVSTIAIPEVQP